MQKIKVGIVGGAGYTGGELIRLLINHPNVNISFIHSKSNTHKHIGDVHSDLFYTNLFFSETLKDEIDVLFLCTGHNESNHFLESNHILDTIKIIDLSQDFRLKKNQHFMGRDFIYGLPELNKEAIIHANNIANPGCFATAIQLSLLPLAKNNLLDEVFITGITGSTGSGQALSNTNHFSWRANNIQPYKTLTHQHLYEINESIENLQNKKATIQFLPYRGNFTRGILISATTKTDKKLDEINEIYSQYYQNCPFTHLSQKMIDLKQVVNTNHCLLFIEQEKNSIVIHSVIDNLLKGAVGQAVQNMNLMVGFEEQTGLLLKAAYF
ncbi:MAG: N-acetyl-gamma-glutamyl-phosphate reductase [Sediminibacterium sp.]|nr:N-acetyl-gamma-glutamyl-phosphate reductase [Sediminibacterium sp.]